MLCDFYELTMGNGYYRNGFYKRNVYFDVFFRRVPDQGGFAIAAGLEQLIDYIENLHFTQEDIAYLRGRNLFCEEFLEYLANFRFTGDIYAVPEGTPVFPKEPLVVVRAPAIEAQLIETFTLLTINHQSLIATKANRIVRAARGRDHPAFSQRRGHRDASAGRCLCQGQNHPAGSGPGTGDRRPGRFSEPVRRLHRGGRQLHDPHRRAAGSFRVLFFAPARPHLRLHAGLRRCGSRRAGGTGRMPARTL